MAVICVAETLTSGAATPPNCTFVPLRVVASSPVVGSGVPWTAMAGPRFEPAIVTISPGATDPCARLAAFKIDVTVAGTITGGGVTGGGGGVCAANSPEIFAIHASPFGSDRLFAPPYLDWSAFGVTGKFVDPVSPARYALPAVSSASAVRLRS